MNTIIEIANEEGIRIEVISPSPTKSSEQALKQALKYIRETRGYTILPDGSLWKDGKAFHLIIA